jgi:hypothetical protein
MLLMVCLSFLACAAITGKLSGIYVAEEGGLFESVEFESDGTCYTTSGLGVDFRMAMQYEIKGNKVHIGLGGQMMPTFEIVDSNTLRGIAFGIGGLYKKE